MPDPDRTRRVEMLEETLKSLRHVPDDLKALKRCTTRVEVEILQLRTEMRDEFSAVRGEMATKAELAEMRMATKAELADMRMATKADLAEIRMATKADLAAMRRDMGQRARRVETRAARGHRGDGRDLSHIILDTQRQMTEGQNQTRVILEEIRSLVSVRREGNPPQS
jgi:hypothetical protein